MIQWPAKVAQIFGKMLLAMRPGRLWLLHWLGECRSWKLERWCRLLVLMRTLSNERLCRVCERASLFMTGQQQLVEKLQPLSHQVCLVTLGSVIVLIIFSPLWMDLCRQPFPRPIPFSLPGETVDCFVCTTDCALRRLRARDGGQDFDEHALCGAGLCHGRSDDDRKKKWSGFETAARLWWCNHLWFFMCSKSCQCMSNHSGRRTPVWLPGVSISMLYI